MALNFQRSTHVPGFFRSPCTVGERIRELREKKGWTQGELARRIGITPQSVRNHEADRNPPHPKTLATYAHVFGIPFQRFISVTNQWKHYEYRAVGERRQ